ncbi:MAG TPA: uracil phosphoribosyltransferase [Synergistales bacterium]|nr:uracil phosphoribosyltransferase [Synergistales bacterium]
MHIALGSDHAGFLMKECVRQYLLEHGHEVMDMGTESEDIKTDYPDYAFMVASEVADGNVDRGILVCGSGIGMSIAANKINGVYAALVWDNDTARLSRAHNNSNILCIGGRKLQTEEIIQILHIWLNTEFEGGRHLKRFEKIAAREKSICMSIEGDGPGETVIFHHPLIQHKVSMIRDKNTSVKEFRELVAEISGLMVYEITRKLPLESIEVETPIARTKAYTLSGKKLAIVPVLRAGLGMVDGILQLIPNAKVGHIGLYRDPQTLEPVEYYCKLPGDIEEREILIIDPMLATGGSASAAISLVKKKGAKKVSLVCLIAAPEGVKKVHSDHPEVNIYAAALDDHLNDHAYIVPGLGDAGDRLFGTR